MPLNAAVTPWGTSELVLLCGDLPVKGERPPLRTVREQAAQRQSDLGHVDAACCGPCHPCAQDMNDSAITTR